MEYLLDVLLFGETEEKAVLIMDYGKDVIQLEPVSYTHLDVYKRQAAPPTTEYRRAAELTQRGDSRLYQRAVFLCGGDHTLTAFCPLAGQPQTRQKGYIYGIFQ